MTWRVCGVVLALIVAAASSGAAVRGRKPATRTVVVQGMRYEPATLTIRAGDSVTWVNEDIVDHTATGSASARPAFDSQAIRVGKSWTHAFTASGRFDYVCTFHPTMHGVIEVAD
jgi:plastocyanin